MKQKFREYKGLDLPRVGLEELKGWEESKTFARSLELRRGAEPFVFYEGPPSANGMPGIHHVMARTLKDIVCRYKTQKGYLVHRKAGWDTHGLPVELGVEKLLGITKEDIGTRISVEEYNATCRREVMKYTGAWEELTRIMGYWVDMDHPYITYDNRYIETLWYLLKELYSKDLLYKGKSIQPYSPAAGTGLSTHELNQPGCYRDVKDTTVVAQFELIRDNRSEKLYIETDTKVYILAWTTTPWTLPSNTALAVGDNIDYVSIRTLNQYTGKPITVILAKDLQGVYFDPRNENLDMAEFQSGGKKIPYRILSTFKGSELVGMRYHQLFPWVKPEGDAFRVVAGDFITTADGTGVVHIAPTFGADDDRVGRQCGIAPLTLRDGQGKPEPMVDRTGKFYRIEDLLPDFVTTHVNTELYANFAGRFVKNDYDPKANPGDTTLDVDLSLWLKGKGLAFRIEKYEHSYPHCWRTDKPVLYYPLDSWFIRTTAIRERMIELNSTINWKPASTGTGRFGKWLENLVDWNLSRSRYWGTPLPIWATDDGKEAICIGSLEQLQAECKRSVSLGLMESNPLQHFVPGNFSDENYGLLDLHRPFVDTIVLASPTGKPMRRDPDLVDVWFDSGAMPYAQVHYPFQEKENFGSVYPADFIAEGVDQTRGWFFTLHALAVMLFDSVAFRNIISNGLVLDKNGNKMSKRLGNAVDPFQVIEHHGTDPLRWYMITNSQPWDNLKFDIEGVEEVKRKFFGTLYNTYSFLALYANVDGFSYTEEEVPVGNRPEIDQWILSVLNSLIAETEEAYSSYEPTRAGRAIQHFVTENLSNWYVRLNRKRFWGGAKTPDKLAAYQTLYTCLETVAMLAAPIAPFYSDRIFKDLNAVTSKSPHSSVHLSDFPCANTSLIDRELEERMVIAQTLTSMVLGLRRKVSLKVRQPLSRIMVPVHSENFRLQLQRVEKLILSEVNVKELEYLSNDGGVLVKKIKPNYKTLGPRFGKEMKLVALAIEGMSQEDIVTLERNGTFGIFVNGKESEVTTHDVEIVSEDIPGWLVANEGIFTVALDVMVTPELRQEGIARELINRIQNLRKEAGLEVTDKVRISILKHQTLIPAIEVHREYIASQTLAREICLVDNMPGNTASDVELDNDLITSILVEKVDV